MSTRVHERWAHLRFSVVGQLLAAPPGKGELRAAIEELAARTWLHPTTGQPVRFGFSTIERWYYRALGERTDPVGVQVGGAIKNVMAVATGACDGLGMGHNARAALITRGLAEITRLGVALGANPLTFLGMSGVGDLVLTCTGDLSRNRTVGLRLGRGESIESILADMKMVAEGVKNSVTVSALAQHAGVEMPITGQMRLMLHARSSRGSPRCAISQSRMPRIAPSASYRKLPVR